MNAVDVFRFALALVLTPIVFGIARRIRIPDARIPFVVGYVAIIVGFAMAAIQPLSGSLVLRSARHLVFSLAGFALAWAAWQVRTYVLASTGERR